MADHSKAEYEYTDPRTGQTRIITLHRKYEVTPEMLEELGIIRETRDSRAPKFPFCGPMRHLYLHGENFAGLSEISEQDTALNTDYLMDGAFGIDI